MVDNTCSDVYNIYGTKYSTVLLDGTALHLYFGGIAVAPKKSLLMGLEHRYLKIQQ